MTKNIGEGWKEIRDSEKKSNQGKKNENNHRGRRN